MKRRGRRLFQVLLLALLAMTVRYWGGLHADGEVGSGGCLIEPSGCSGSTQVYSLVSVLAVHADGAADVEVGRRTLRVTGLPANTTVGERISFGGVFQSQPVAVHAAWSHRSERQRGKYALALVALGMFALWTPWWLRRDGQGWRLDG